MCSAKHAADSFGGKHTHHTTGAGEISELVDNYGRKQTHQTAGEEEDLLDVSNMQVFMLQSDSHLPECWQWWDLVPIPYRSSKEAHAQASPCKGKHGKLF